MTTACPVFNEMLDSMFSQHSDPENMVEYIQEVCAYLAQPKLSTLHCFVWMGSNADGRTALADVLTAIIWGTELPSKIVYGLTGNTTLSTPVPILILAHNSTATLMLPVDVQGAVTVVPFKPGSMSQKQYRQCGARIIKEELPGVRELLSISHRRLHDRGHFVIPESCWTLRPQRQTAVYPQHTLWALQREGT